MLNENIHCAMPFFDRYDMRVEFARRTELAIRPFRKQREPYSATMPFDPADLEFEICPIRLQTAAMTIEVGAHPVYRNTGPNARIHHTGRIPYTGDDELWNLYPAPLSHHPDGEIFRGDLVLVSNCNMAKVAEKEFASRLAAIEAILEHQRLRIAEFEKSFPEWARRAWLASPLVVPDPFVLN